MPRNLANALLILLLLIFAVASWQWLEERDPQQPSAQSTITMTENETDYTLENFLITNVNNTKGQVYQLSGKSLSHFINGSDSIIDQPSVQMSGANQQQWTGNASFGYLSSDFTKLKLAGNVELTHRRGDSMPINVATEALNINTQTRQMESADSVNIEGQQWSFRASQMQADLDNGILSFQSGVEANYAVSQ